MVRDKTIHSSLQDSSWVCAKKVRAYIHTYIYIYIYTYMIHTHTQTKNINSIIMEIGQYPKRTPLRIV